MCIEQEIIILFFWMAMLSSAFGIITKQKKSRTYILSAIVTQIVIAVITAVVASLLMKKPKVETPKAGSLEDFDFPTIDQTRKIQVVFGKVRQKDPNIVWYGDLKTTAIRK